MSSTRIFLAVAVAAALNACASAGTSGESAGYLVAEGRQPVRDGFGECWHTREWHAGMRFANCEPRMAAAKAAPVRHSAPLAVAAKPAPEPPVPLRLSADTLFRFDSVVLTAKGRSVLDGLGKRIAAADYRAVAITGHADPLGTSSYNLSLSERRAEVVRDYLVARGLDARRIHTTGAGSMQPFVSIAQCNGKPRAQLIECLQPDRYAEISVAGTLRTASAR